MQQEQEDSASVRVWCVGRCTRADRACVCVCGPSEHRAVWGQARGVVPDADDAMRARGGQWAKAAKATASERVGVHWCARHAYGVV